MFHKLKYLTLIGLLALPWVADAEQRGRARHQQQHHQQRARSARAEAMAPPKQLAQVLLPAGARRVNERIQPPRAGWNRWPQSHRPWWKHQQNNYPQGNYYAVPYGGFGYGVAYEDEGAPPPPPASVPTNKGVLQFDIIPASGLDYYIDGVHVGSSSTLGSEFEVNAGARQVEVRAPGYKPSTFDKRIEEGQVTTVRGALERLEQPQAPSSPGSRVMYVIPGCYMGNTKPVPSALPPGCDIKKMVTR